MFRFKDFTTENKIQQSELMELFGIGQSTVSNLVNGKIPITENRIQILKQKYGSALVEKYVVPELPTETVERKPDPAPTDAMTIINRLIASNEAKDEELSQLRKELAHLTRCFQVLAERYGVSATSIEKTAI